MDMKSRAKKLKQDIPTVFLCLKDANTPFIVKLLAALTVGYALSPIDFIPDFIPVLGYLDDLILLPAMVALTIRCIPQEVWQRNTALSAGMWQNGQPKKWYYALPIVAVWGIISWVIIKAIFF